MRSGWAWYGCISIWLTAGIILAVSRSLERLVGVGDIYVLSDIKKDESVGCLNQLMNSEKREVYPQSHLLSFSFTSKIPKNQRKKGVTTHP